MKKLVIVEYTTHEPYIRALVELFCDEYEIVVLTSEEYCKKFFKGNAYYNKCKIIVKKKKLSYSEFYFKNQQFLKEADVVFLNTLCREYWGVKRYINRCKVVLTIHNLNDLFGYNKITYEDFKSHCFDDVYGNPSRFHFVNYWIKNKLLTLNDYFCNKRILNLADVICVYHQNMAELVSTTLSKKSIVLPFKLPDELLPLPESPRDEVVLAILGLVDSTRKNYIEVIEALNNAKLRAKVSIYIIGKCDNINFEKKLINLILNISNPNLNVIFENPKEWIKEEQIREQVKKVHFLVAATKPTINVRLSIERYGKTKTSGCDFDALSFNRLIFNDSSYTPITDLSSFTISYKKYDDFVDVINKSFDENYFKSLYDPISKFDIEELKNKYKIKFHDLITN